MTEKKQLPQKQLKGTWVQTDRKSHELWAKLSIRYPRASALLHVLVSEMGQQNAIVVSQKNLARMLNCTTRTIRNSLVVLEQENWIETRQIGQNGTINAYIVNDRVAWFGNRDGIRYSLFTATILISDDEQKAGDKENQEPLINIPTIFKDEGQIPFGEGLPPPSQPILEGFEPDLPTRNYNPETGEILEIEHVKKPR